MYKIIAISIPLKINIFFWVKLCERIRDIFWVHVFWYIFHPNWIINYGQQLMSNITLHNITYIIQWQFILLYKWNFQYMNSDRHTLITQKNVTYENSVCVCVCVEGNNKKEGITHPRYNAQYCQCIVALFSLITKHWFVASPLVAFCETRLRWIYIPPSLKKKRKRKNIPERINHNLHYFHW